MTKPRQIERSVFFLLDQNGQTQIYRLVSGQLDVWLWRNCDFSTKDDDLEKYSLELCRTATIKPRQIERSVFFNGAIFQKTVMIAKTLSLAALFLTIFILSVLLFCSFVTIPLPFPERQPNSGRFPLLRSGPWMILPETVLDMACLKDLQVV